MIHPKDRTFYPPIQAILQPLMDSLQELMGKVWKTARDSFHNLQEFFNPSRSIPLQLDFENDPDFKSDIRDLLSQKENPFSRSSYDRNILLRMAEIEKTVLLQVASEEKESVKALFAHGLVSLLRRLHDAYYSSEGRLIEDSSAIAFSAEGIIHLPSHYSEQERKNQLRILYCLVAHTFGIEIAEAIWNRYQWYTKEELTYEDVKNVYSFTSAYALTYRLKDLYHEIRRDAHYRRVWDRLTPALQKQIPQTFLDGQSEEYADFLQIFRGDFPTDNPDLFLSGMREWRNEAPYLLCKNEIPLPIRRTIAQKTSFEELTNAEYVALYRAFCGVWVSAEKENAHFLPFAHSFFGTVATDFRQFGTFRPELHDRKMTQECVQPPEVTSPKFLLQAISEHLARDVIYAETRPDMPILTFDPQGELALWSVLDQLPRQQDGFVVDLIGAPFPRVDRKKDLYPLHLVIRGTQWSPIILESIEGALANFDVTGAGNLLYQRRKQDLIQCITRNLEQLSQKVGDFELVLDGHSMGGCFCERAIIDILKSCLGAKAQSPWSRVRKIRLESFNSVQPDAAVWKEFKELIHQLNDGPVDLHVHVNVNLSQKKNGDSNVFSDPAQEIGDAHVGHELHNSKKFTRTATVNTICEPGGFFNIRGLRRLHSHPVFSLKRSYKNPVHTHLLTEEKDCGELDKIYAGKYREELREPTTEQEKAARTVRWLLGVASKPFLFVTFYVLAALAHLWAWTMRWIHPHRSYYYRPGKFALFMHRVGFNVDPRLVVDPSFYY